MADFNSRLLTFSTILFLSFTVYSNAATLKGHVIDSETHETVAGAFVDVVGTKEIYVSDVDGSFVFENLGKGTYSLSVKMLGYKSSLSDKILLKSNDAVVNYDIYIKPKSNELNSLVVTAGAITKASEIGARLTERESPNLMNVVSAKAIELSPDVDVASVVMRMSGVTLDKSSSGSGQYALLRGMDKRYSYTLVNGIKIPSTNDNHRYTSLDMFPAYLQDRIEVSKVLTPDMEGDAISGAVNLVMKNAPDHFFYSVDVTTGYNAIWNNMSFMTFNNSVINQQSPYELNGAKYNALPSDFTKTNLDLKSVNLPINTIGNFSIGNRFFDKKLGWIFAGSLNNSYTGTHSRVFGASPSSDTTNVETLTSMQDRVDYTQQLKYGLHNKLDVSISSNHSLQLYVAYINSQTIQVRDAESTELGNNSYDPDHGGKNMTHSDRNFWKTESLLNGTLQGNHAFFSNHFTVQWSAVYSKANSQTPDLSTISYGSTYVNSILQPQYVDYGGSGREWMHNSDIDKAGYLNLKYKTDILRSHLELSAGVMYRDKTRSNFDNKYTLISQGPVDAHSAKGVDWQVYSDINWTVSNPTGATNASGTYNAYENVKAEYAMLLYKIWKFRIIGGARYEECQQGYDQVFHNAFLDKFKPGNPQKRDFLNKNLLPSGNIEYDINNFNDLKVSYYKAINKPGFKEVVPYAIATEDYQITGNPDLKYAVADNIDLRYEYFPNQQDQVLAGVFYKKIDNAIEEGFVNDGHGNNNLTFLNSNAENYGFEADLIKFYGELGVKANYTWTHSNTSSAKKMIVNGVLAKNRDSTAIVIQYRPLYGQAENVANLSLLYKGDKNGLNGQLSFSYTGDRIYRVGSDINGDQWEKPILQMDISAEKKFKSGVGIFIKARNLLNTHTSVYLKQVNPLNSQFPEHGASDKTTFLRDDYSDRSYLIGIRYKFN
jgi:hypothetical protein